MAEAARIIIGAGVDAKGDAAITLEAGASVLVLDIYEAMAFSDLLARKIGEAINWHKLAHDPDAPELLHTPAHGNA